MSHARALKQNPGGEEGGSCQGMGLPTMTRLTSLRMRLLAANHSAKPLKFFTRSKRAMLQRAKQEKFTLFSATKLGCDCEQARRTATALLKTDLATAYLCPANCTLHVHSVVMQAAHGSRLSLDQLKPEEDERTASSAAHLAKLRVG